VTEDISGYKAPRASALSLAAGNVFQPQPSPVFTPECVGRQDTKCFPCKIETRILACATTGSSGDL
jgi:hypothetical protein